MQLYLISLNRKSRKSKLFHSFVDRYSIHKLTGRLTNSKYTEVLDSIINNILCFLMEFYAVLCFVELFQRGGSVLVPARRTSPLWF